MTMNDITFQELEVSIFGGRRWTHHSEIISSQLPIYTESPRTPSLFEDFYWISKVRERFDAAGVTIRCHWIRFVTSDPIAVDAS